MAPETPLCKYIITGGKKGAIHRHNNTLILKSVKKYRINGTTETLPDLNVGRFNHACGKFDNDDGATVSLHILSYNKYMIIELQGSPCNWR